MKTKSMISMLVLFTILLFSCTKEKTITEPGNLVPRTADQDPGVPSIIVNGAVLHSEAFGHPDSTMIVCIHGGPGSDYRYMLNLKDLADHGYRVVFYDQRGSGLSQRFPREYYISLGTGALDVIYDELKGVIAHYRTRPDQKVFLAGHSWGAMLATAFAGRYPDALQGLALCEPGGLKWEDVMEFINKSHSLKLLGETMNNLLYLDQFITGKEDQHEILDYKMAIMTGKNETTGDDLTMPGSFWRSGAVIQSAFFEIGKIYKPDFSEGISNFSVPVLFFYSGKDKAYPDEWARKISGVYNEVELCKVPGVGHDGIVSDKKAWTETTLPKLLAYFNSL